MDKALIGHHKGVPALRTPGPRASALNKKKKYGGNNPGRKVAAENGHTSSTNKKGT